MTQPHSSPRAAAPAPEPSFPEKLPGVLHVLGVECLLTRTHRVANCPGGPLIFAAYRGRRGDAQVDVFHDPSEPAAARVRVVLSTPCACVVGRGDTLPAAVEQVRERVRALAELASLATAEAASLAEVALAEVAP